MAEASRSLPGSAAVFDVDGTLCATRSTTSLVWHRRQQDPVWRHRRWMASLAWKAPAAWLADQVSREIADRLVYAQYAGLRYESLLEDAGRCCDEVLLAACFPDALAELEAHRSAGRRIILLSGGLDVVLRPLADALGADLLAQRLEVREGRCTGRHRGWSELEGRERPASQAAGKGEALRAFASAHGLDLGGSFAYGDSINDAAMLRAVGTAVAVNPDRRLRRLADAEGWKIRRWAAPPRANPAGR